MKNRFRLIQRGLRGGRFYCVDSETGRRESLGTKDSDEATQIVLAKNQSVRQPALGLQMAKAFLSATDDALAKRTWKQAIDTLVEAKHNSTKARWLRSMKHTAFDSLRERPIIEAHAEHFLAVLKAGTASTNMHLRQIQNFVLRSKLASPPHHPAPAMAPCALPRPSRHHPCRARESRRR
jgi:hypothetical protein